ncbi:ribosomal maturation YjgA family protein [Streptomyces sp. NPDC002911]
MQTVRSPDPHAAVPGASAPRTAVVRATAVVAALVTVAAGLGVRAAAGGDVTKYAGDALYTVLIHTLVVVLVPRVRPLTAAGAALAFSWAVELAQLTGVPADLARQSTVARLVLGSTFNAPDLPWYGVGAALAWAVHTRLRSRRPLARP